MVIKAGRLLAFSLILTLVSTAPLGAAEDETRDALAVPADFAAGLPAAAPRDSFAEGREFASFPPADVPFDAWARPGDRSPFLPFPPPLAGGPIDELGTLGDEEEVFAGGPRWAGGWGPGGKRVVILMYHRFRAYPANPYEVSYYDFEAQMDYIAQNGYVVIPVEQLVDALVRQDPDLLPPRGVVITVDDGYRCVYDYAWPVFRAHDFPFAVYIYTNYIQGGGNSMTWDEVRAMAADPLVSVGAHSVSHPNLANPKRAVGDYAAWLSYQLNYPKQRLEAETGRPVRTLAWPYGSFNHYTLNAAVRAGYEGVLTVAPGANDLSTSPFMLHRYGVYWRTSLAGFARMLEGRYVPTDEVDYYTLAGQGKEDEFLIP